MRPAAGAAGEFAGVTTTFALATPSYRGDLDRCRLLCASIDRFVTGQAVHYLLVEDRDVPLFRDLEGPRRRILPESQLLPHWLKSIPDPLSFGKRRIWTGLGAAARGLPPLRGWHTQQLRKFAVAKASSEDVVLFADSGHALRQTLRAREPPERRGHPPLPQAGRHHRRHGAPSAMVRERRSSARSRPAQLSRDPTTSTIS